MAQTLSSTSYVILGMLAGGPRSGYDIKTLADHSVRFFWNLSYSQIYPELKRLSELGLAEPEPAARGERRRTVYRITASGREALHDWLVQEGPSTVEMRDEMLLKLFFSDAMSPGEQLAHVRAMRRREEEMVRTLRQIEPTARAEGAPACRLFVLLGGIGLHQNYADFLAQADVELTKEVHQSAATTR